MKKFRKEKFHINFDCGYFVLLLLIFLMWIYLPSGIYLGGDWGSYASENQAIQQFFPWTWSPSINFGNPNFIGLGALPYELFIWFYIKAGLPLLSIGKIILTIVFSLIYVLQYRLLRYLKLNEISAIIGGLLYLASPVVFNYAAMGWYYVLFSMALFPLAFKWLCQSIRQKDSRFLLGIAIIWALATMQSQSIVWFPLIFIVVGIFLISDFSSAKVYLKSICKIFLVYFSLISYLWLPLVLFKDIEITNSSIVTSSTSVGADLYFTPLNAVRLWGSFFNFQYESAISISCVLISFLLPILVGIVFLTTKKNLKLAVSLSFIAFILPFGLLLLKEYREILAVIPGSGLIRQLSRFTVLSTFAYSVLIGIFIESLLLKKLYKTLLITSLSILLFASVWPWWMGELTTLVKTPGPDFRLRVKEFPVDYFETEKFLGQINIAAHALYLPYGLSSSYKDDMSFNGMFKEGVDIFALYSSMPGIFMPTDRPSTINDYVSFISHSQNIIEATHLSLVNFYVLRKNMEPGPVIEVFREPNRYFPSDLFDRIWDSENITIYAKKTLIPLIYTPSNCPILEGSVNTLNETTHLGLNVYGMAVLFAAQNSEKVDSMARFSAASEIPDAVEYHRINPTKYRIRLHHVRGDVPLIFGESYSRGWRLYPVAYQATKMAAPISNDNKSTPSNKRFHADTSEIKEFAAQGWISEKRKRFISKRFLGSIQNDNLPNGSLMETWYSQPLPEEQHIKVNGYANGWLVDVTQLSSDPQISRKNNDGSFDLEFIMEFWPQQLFYLGLAITVLTLLLSLGWILVQTQFKNDKRQKRL